MSLYYFALIISASLGILWYRSMPQALKPFVMLLPYTCLHEWIVHAQIFTSNIPLYWIYPAFSMALYLEFVKRVVDSRIKKTMILCSQVVFIGIGITGAITGSSGFPSGFIISGIPVLVAGCLLVFYELLTEISDEPISKNPIFLVAAAILIYQSVAFCFLGMVTLFMSSGEKNKLIFEIFKYATTIYYCLFGYSFLLASKYPRKLMSHV